MKIMLDICLKIGSGVVIPSGRVFDDSQGPIPEFVMRRLRRKQAHIISGGSASAMAPSIDRTPPKTDELKVPTSVGKILKSAKGESKSPKIPKVPT
jgi:hypothetical protein